MSRTPLDGMALAAAATLPGLPTWRSLINSRWPGPKRPSGRPGRPETSKSLPGCSTGTGCGATIDCNVEDGPTDISAAYALATSRARCTSSGIVLSPDGSGARQRLGWGALL